MPTTYLLRRVHANLEAAGAGEAVLVCELECLLPAALGPVVCMNNGKSNRYRSVRSIAALQIRSLRPPLCFSHTQHDSTGF